LAETVDLDLTDFFLVWLDFLAAPGGCSCPQEGKEKNSNAASAIAQNLK
jgi:hypothetical protein